MRWMPLNEEKEDLDQLEFNNPAVVSACLIASNSVFDFLLAVAFASATLLPVDSNLSHDPTMMAFFRTYLGLPRKMTVSDGLRIFDNVCPIVLV